MTRDAERPGLADDAAAQRQRLEIAVEAMKLGLWDWNLRTNEVTFSARNREIFGLGPDEPITLERYLGLLHPDDIGAIRQAFRAARDQPGGGDFSIEHRVVAPDGAVRWVLVDGRVATDADGPLMVLGTSLEITQRRVAEEQRSLLMGELAHRAKNGIAVMMAMVHQTGRTADSVAAFEAALTRRLRAMADAQDLVTAAGGRPVLLSDVLDRTLAPFASDRFDMSSDLGGVAVAGDLATGLALLLHEMATNAVKHGALSNDTGRVAVACTAQTPGRLTLSWREGGGPPVSPPERQGFGTRLLQSSLRSQGGRVAYRFEPDGFVACVELPHDA